MILYNVTVSINPEIENDWKNWMAEKHIPDALNTQCFYRCVLSKIQGNEAGECTFSVLYWAKKQGDIDSYMNNFASELQSEHRLRYEGKFVAFRTTMDVVKTFE